MMPTSIPLASIPLDELVLWREVIAWRKGKDHSRWVFVSRRSGSLRLVFKIWNPGYVRRDNILSALEAGLYDRSVTPALRGIIFHEGICRGYVMECWGRNRRVSGDFVRSLWQRTRESGHFAAQYRLFHTRRRGSTVTLIDLEAAYPVTSLQHRGPINIEDQDYRKLVEALAAGSLSAEDVQQMADQHLAHSRAPIALTALGAWMRRKRHGLRRRAERYLRTPDSRHLIQT